jgi:hypothetical protein
MRAYGDGIPLSIAAGASGVAGCAEEKKGAKCAPWPKRRIYGKQIHGKEGREVRLFVTAQKK